MPSNVRFPKVVIRTKDRKGLNSYIYPSIDSFLKPLKSTCRRLQIATTTLANEEQLLQRIYYKGKNQHRSALFWRRTSELRRYSERARVLDLTDTIVRLRCSFFGEEALTSQSLTKGAWNHFPDVGSIDSVLECCLQAQALFIKFHTISMEAYSSFTTFMQSGAFIQILLVLAAISARMNGIVEEYEDILGPLLLSLYNLKAATTNPAISLGSPSDFQLGDYAPEDEIVTRKTEQSPESIIDRGVQLQNDMPVEPVEVPSRRDIVSQKDAPSRNKKPTTKLTSSQKSKDQKRPMKKVKCDEIDNIFGT